MFLNIPVVSVNANWEKYGKMAGPVRNRAMAKNADIVILLPGGRGTTSMRKEAVSHGLIVIDITHPARGA